MRPSNRLLLALSTPLRAQPSRFLTPGTQTGLTGLRTHPCPRSTLIYLYSETLSKLSSLLPAHSAYRAAASAIAQHRLEIVKSVAPQGYAEWAARARELIAADPDKFGAESSAAGEWAPEYVEARAFRRMGKNAGKEAELELEWDGEEVVEEPEGPRTRAERKAAEVRRVKDARESKIDEQGLGFERSPPLEASQIAEIENKIGAGLIEEVIQVAEGELKLVDVMAEKKVWEELQDKAPHGQWEYHGRQKHMPQTQEA